MTDHAAIIESTVREQLAKADVHEVRVREGEDFDGNPIYDVIVVADLRGVDIGKLTGLVRHTRHKLEPTQGADRFPMFRFLSPEDARERDAAIA